MTLNNHINEERHILERISFGHLSTIMSNGSPHVTPVWIDFKLKENLLFISMYENCQKDKNLKKNPFFAISINDPNNPYNYIQIRGKSIKRSLDEGGNFADYLIRKYSKGNHQKYPADPSKNLIIYSLKPINISGWKKTSADNFLSWLHTKEDS